MNYSNITNDWDQQLRDAMADLPAPTDEEIDQMLNELAAEDEARREGRGYQSYSELQDELAAERTRERKLADLHFQY